MSNTTNDIWNEHQREIEEEEAYKESEAYKNRRSKPFEVIMGIDDFLFNQVKK